VLEGHRGIHTINQDLLCEGEHTVEEAVEDAVEHGHACICNSP
jgi:hypothetical protein